MVTDSTGSYIPRYRIEKYEAGQVEPFEVIDRQGNLTTTAGKVRLASLITGSGQGLDTTHARIAVGNGSVAAAAGDDVSDIGTTSVYLKLPSSVTASSNVVTLVATFAPAVANFAWNSWGIDIKTAAGAADGTTAGDILLNRKVDTDLGTKTSSQTWVFTATLTF